MIIIPPCLSTAQVRVLDLFRGPLAGIHLYYFCRIYIEGYWLVDKMNFSGCTCIHTPQLIESSREITKDARVKATRPRRAFVLNINSTSTLPYPMFSQPSTFHTPDNTNDRMRPQLNHPASQSSLHASFSVGGISSSTSTHHPHGTSSWASNSQSSTLPNSFNDPFLQSRSNYQSGYLMVCHLPHRVKSVIYTCVPLVNVSE